MMPGMGRGMNPRQMQMMMKKMGMAMDELDGVEEVIIRTTSEEYHFLQPSVTIMDVKGQKTFQVTGEPEITRRGGAAGEGGGETLAIAEEDIELVAIQANVDPEVARDALVKTDGNPAEAIIMLSQQD